MQRSLFRNPVNRFALHSHRRSRARPDWQVNFNAEEGARNFAGQNKPTAKKRDFIAFLVLRRD
jgi:hypothetical protein